MDLEQIVNKATQNEKVTVAVAVAEDIEVLEAVSLANDRKLAKFILFGDSNQIHLLLKKHAPHLLELDDIIIKHEDSPVEACTKAVMAVKNHEASVLMKGNVATSTILKEVLNRDYGLRTGNVLSHIAVFEVPRYERLILITDAAMNITPNLDQKQQIVQNAVQLAHAIGIGNPKVAALAAVEVVNPSMQATLDAAALRERNKNGSISGCRIEGPLALDIAVSKEAAIHKGIENDVAGAADILLVPNIETGNALYKSLIYFANAQVSAMIAGAAAPIVLTSRSDSAISKLYSLALAICSTKK